MAFYVKRPELRSKFESLAFELLDVSAKASIENDSRTITTALSVISSLDAMVRLAHSIYEIEPVNATILVRELDNLNSAIRQFGKLDEKSPDIESLFSVMPMPDQVSAPVSFRDISSEDNNDASLDAYRSSNDQQVSLDQLSNPNSEVKVTRENQSANIAVRQSAILNKIKIGNGSGARLKDLLAEFPDVSERTIRYDLQKLCDGGSVERVGNGGPATYYRVVAGH